MVVGSPLILVPCIFIIVTAYTFQFVGQVLLKMLSTAFAETQFFKQPEHTSQKSILSFGTVILQKHLSFMEISALTQPLGCNKGTLSARLFLPSPFTELHPRSNQT